MIENNNKLILTKNYHNFYLGGARKNIDLHWSFYSGFKSLEEAIEFIEKEIVVHRWEYLYLEYNNEFYPVAILEHGVQIIITKQFIMFRSRYYGYYQKIKSEDFIKKYRKYSFFFKNDGFYKYEWDTSFIYWLEGQNIEIPKCFDDNGKPKEFAYTRNFKQSP